MDYKEKLKELSTEEKITLLTGYDGFSAVNLPEKNLNGIKMADGPYGLKTKKGDTVCYPNPCLTACSWDEEVCRKIGDYLGRDCVNHGVDLLLAPAINIKRNPLGGRNFEYYSEDPVLTAKLAAGYVEGVKNNGVAVCAKHFACNNQEKDRWVYNCVVNDDALRNLYLTAFEILLKNAEVDCVMAAYNRINDVYCCENSYILQDILRKEWGYEGVVVSDWCAANDIIKSFKNGLDLEMPSNAHITVPALKKALKKGEITERELDEKAEKLLKLYYGVKGSVKKTETDERKKAEELRKLTGECFVLLKNEKGVLPFRREERVLLVGTNAVSPKIQGGGCANMNTDSIQIPYEEIKKYCPRCDVIKNYDLSGADLSVYDKIAVFTGLSSDNDSEAIDRTTAKFPEEQLDCIKIASEKNGNVIAVLQNGGAMDLSFEPRVKGILETYYAGSFGGGAIADVLFGTTNPCGKLAETFPLSFENLPVLKEKNYGGDIFYSEGEFVGYRYFSSFGVKTRYPFGYGLSYSEYKVGNITVKRLGEYRFKVSAEIKNASSVAGRYVLQVYLKSYDEFAPKLRLVNFVTVRLNAGEERQAELTIEKECFERYAGGKKRLVTGRYGVCVAESSENLLYEKDFDFCGESGEEKKDFTRRTLVGTLLKDEKYRKIALSFMERSILDWAFGKEAEHKSCSDFEKDAFLKNSVYGMPIRAFTYFGQNDFDEDKEREMLKRLNAVCE